MKPVRTFYCDCFRTFNIWLTWGGYSFKKLCPVNLGKCILVSHLPLTLFLPIASSLVRVGDWCRPSQPAVLSPVAHPASLAWGSEHLAPGRQRAQRLASHWRCQTKHFKVDGLSLKIYWCCQRASLWTFTDTKIIVILDYKTSKMVLFGL